MKPFVDPSTFEQLNDADDALVSESGARFSVVHGIPRFCEIENYSSSFGRQWNLFEKTQIDQEAAVSVSALRLFAETGWREEGLSGLDILEVGSGAGRFSRVILQRTSANLYSVDYSTAVEANWRNNGVVGRNRFFLAQANIYAMPFPNDRFDKVLCLGVLQHTPDFARSIEALIDKAKPGGEIVVDFYPIRGWWTKIHAKYLLRPLTRRMDQERLLRLIERNIDWMMGTSRLLGRIGLHALTRFLPLVDQRTLPSGLTSHQRREWSVLDTLDMYSPAHDHPQSIRSVRQMFERRGAVVTFAGLVSYKEGTAAVVRARKRSVTFGR